MPPEKVAQTASWGKRPRDADEAIVRFSDLSPEQKVARRRQERQEKKERERTMSYFKSVQRVLEEHAAGSGDANVLASLVDGFFVELVKLIKADPSLHLLRNGTVCRVIELGLANALLLQSKSLLYVFLGHVAELATSPVASYVLESICLSISQGLSALAATSTEQLEMELVVGGAGSHVGSGVPSSATLLNSMVEELVEAMDDLIAHEVGARALRSIVLVLGGHTIRDAPTPPHRIVLDDVLARLAEGVIAAVEGGRYHAKNPAEAWMAAVQAPTTGFIIQSLLRVCVDGSPADRIVRVRLDGLSYRGEAFLRFLLRDALGCHTLQAYIKVAAPVKVVRDYTAYAMRRDGAKDGKSAWLKNVGVDDDDDDDDASSSSFTVSDECCWSRAARLVHHELDDLLSPQSSLVLQASFVVHDLALYAPTVLHLEWLWATMIQPRLATFLQISSLAAVLAAMTRKYAFAGSVADENENGNATTSGAAMIPADLNQLLRRDEAQQVPYFDVPMAMQKELCEALVEAVKTSGCAKGVAQFLLADAQLGDRGVEMMRYLLHLHPLASTRIQNSFDKLRVDDVVRLSCQHGGSLAIQQLLRAESYRTTNSSNNSAPSTSSSSNNNNKKEGGGMVARFLRRIQEHLGVLARDRFGAFVVEVLYIVCCIDEKEALIKALVPLYESLKSAGEMEQMSNNNNNNTTTEEVGEMDGLSTDMQKRLVLRKVCQKCCVEQYLHRPDDWRKLAERQQQVQRLVWRMWMGY